MNQDNDLLKEAVQKTRPFFDVFVSFKGNEFLLYNEPDWMKYIRIKSSLEAMTDFILDEQIPISIYRPGEHPFFLKTNTRNSMWGRITWIEDLGKLEYAPAYDNLREVWLHDYDEEVSSQGFYSLCMLADERTLDDIEERLRKPDILEEKGNLVRYLHGLRYFKTDNAVKLIMDLANTARSLYNAYIFNESESVMNSRASLNEGATTPLLEEVILTLGCINTEYAIKSIKEILFWFPKNIPLSRKCHHFLNLDADSETKLIVQSSYNKELAGFKEADIPF